ncbi:MAG: hypothetical protein HC844_19530 [Tabrizicola sp.]|nr:hypothetical protein [Tabrizicola sp.]
MRWMTIAGKAVMGMAVMGTAVLAQDRLAVAGHEVALRETEEGETALVVDGAAVHENEVILLDPSALTVAGVTVITGVAGTAGNACNATPFVLMLPDGEAPRFWGPIESCAYFEPQVQTDAIVFASEPLPSEPGEVWVWNPVSGLTEASPVEFGGGAELGWDALPTLAGAHPVEALKITPVLVALQAGLGADYPAFAERISELGSGDLTAEGYLGQACLKFTCEADFAVLYIHKASQQVFAIWRVTGEVENRIWPEDTSVWPAEAMLKLREVAGE